jgi:acetyl esterase
MKLAKSFAWMLGVVLMLSSAVYVAFRVSPWPSALMIRNGMNRGATGLARSLEKYTPSDVSSQLNENYRTGDADAYLDVFFPAEIGSTKQALPTILWIHGGAWLSGSKESVSGYLKILASKGFTTIGINYSLSPETNYPLPIKQANAALGYINENAARLHVDSSRIFLAGDSSGAQIAAQVALILSAPGYAELLGERPAINRSQIRGLILYCGMFDFEIMPIGSMPITGGLRSALWSYIGYKEFLTGPELNQMSVARHVTSEFPPAFLSVGNGDWLAPQSQILAAAMERDGISIDRLFFPDYYEPRVGHQFQFYLDAEAGTVALKRSLEFLKIHSR